MDAAPVAPGGAQALINNDVIAVADIELIDVAAIATHQEIIAAAPVEGFTEVGTGDGLVGIGTNQVDVFWIEVGIAQGAVGKFEAFDRIMLAIVPDVLIFQDDLVARAAQRDDQVEGCARHYDVGRINRFEHDAVVALAVERCVDAIAAPEGIDVVAAHANQAIIAGAAVDAVGDGFETIYVIVTRRLGDIDVVLE